MENQSNSNDRYSVGQTPEVPPVFSEQRESIPPLKPANWLWQSIVATILCCLPFGIVGIVYASRVDSNYYSGRYDEAFRVAKLAKKWTLIAIGAGLVYSIIWGILFATGMLPDVMTEIIENSVSGYNY